MESQAIGPFPQGGLDEAFGFPIRLGVIGKRKGMSDGMGFTNETKGTRAITGSVVGQDSLDPNALLAEMQKRSVEKRSRRLLFLINQDFGIAAPGMGINGDMQAFPANPSGTDAVVPVDAMTDAFNLSELFDVQVQQAARLCDFITNGMNLFLQG